MINSDKEITDSENPNQPEYSIEELLEKLAKSKNKNKRNNKIISDQTQKINQLELKVQQLKSELLEKDKELHLLAQLSVKNQELESEKAFLKKRIEVLVNTSTSLIKFKETLTPKVSRTEELSPTKGPQPQFNFFLPQNTFEEKVSDKPKILKTKSYSQTSLPRPQVNPSFESSSKEKVVATEKEVSDLISSLSYYKRKTHQPSLFKPKTDAMQFISQKILSNQKKSRV